MCCRSWQRRSRFYVQGQFAARFPASKRMQDLEFPGRLGQFTHRVQHAHVRSLLAAAPCIALSSDITDQYTALDARGRRRSGSFAAAADRCSSLDALVPRQQARLVASANGNGGTSFPRAVSLKGRTVQVAGVVAERS